MQFNHYNATVAQVPSSRMLNRGLDQVYLDLAGAAEAFTMNGLEHAAPVTTTWGQVFDGVVYIAEMTGPET